MDNPTCETCRWWEAHEPDGFMGLCRRNPPAIVLVNKLGDPTALFPETDVGVWCGEHQPRQPAEAEAPPPRIDPETRRVLEEAEEGFRLIAQDDATCSRLTQLSCVHIDAIRAHLAKLDGGDHG